MATGVKHCILRQIFCRLNRIFLRSFAYNFHVAFGSKPQARTIKLAPTILTEE